MAKPAASLSDSNTLIYYEMKAYEGLGIQNFYLGQLPKAEYYQERFLRGKMENDKSIVKGAAIQFVKTHLERKKIRYDGNNIKNREDPAGPKFNRLPSPAGQIKKGNEVENCKINSKAINLLPHLTEE